MPKVNEDYLNKKIAQILDAAFVIFEQKPLYEMTMLDVIKEAGISKGGIYRYYADIDEVIIALLNRESAKSNYKNEIDEILAKSESKKAIIEALFDFLANYINDSPPSLGKFQFELTVYLSNHPEKADKFKKSLTEQENGQYLISSIFNAIKEGISNGEFKPIFSINDVFTYIITSIDGVVNKVVLQKCYGTSGISIDVVKLFEMISSSVIYMLGVNQV